MPTGTEFSEEALAKPRELFHSEAVGGHKSYLVNLGDLAFNSPSILGGKARQAEMSCGTCHINGASNPKLFVPGASSRPGTFDTTSLMFNPKAFNSILDPVRIPSLRGARFLAPYGHDGRMTSLRDFIYNVIVNEFDGPRPSDAVLDGLVAYINDIDFLPNPRLSPGGMLTTQASNAERRGEQLFFKPFPHQPQLSCATCHLPTGVFTDQTRHDVGSGGLVKTPALLNANFNAPYFHDGRYDTYEEVVGHFDRVFDLGLSSQDTQDLVAYLTAVGDGDRPFDKDGVAIRMKEVRELASVLELAIPAADTAVVSLAVTGVGAELRELTEHIPDIRYASVGGQEERLAARTAVKDLVLSLRRIDLAVAASRLDEAMAEYENFSMLATFDVPVALKKAEPWSLFNANVHQSHYAALGRMLQSTVRQSQ
ncbi:cytochrome-c peroxidase [Bradyrhizobium cenepequi]|uniref:cytochrome-c peroxidase n=1 Tax=Bradyrhizobium cenepequi TaxID=2821403 RepID=UPI001CE27BEB|nr:cytochrome-c peroxidase [Bradyrhizobium cenepequi]